VGAATLITHHHVKAPAVVVVLVELALKPLCILHPHGRTDEKRDLLEERHDFG
jgi:hypothetical protein